ncbi:MAG: DUF349 domain-containing protein [Arenicellaceae bacterium]|nr:DUF349 domain-containing protein [Arenicellaceae bacterium]
MLSGIFKPAWQSESVTKRVLALEKMDVRDVANQAIFESLAKADEDVSVRQAALAKLTTPEKVFLIGQSHSDPETRECADAVFAALVGPKSELSDREFRDFLAAQPKAVLLVAQHCPHSDIRNELIEPLSEIAKADLIAGVEYSETRQLIAHQLNSQEALAQARKLLKGKDKSAEKIIKTKLDVIHAEHRQAQQNAEEAQRISESMEYLLAHIQDWQPDFEGRYQAAVQQWESLKFAPAGNALEKFSQARSKFQTELTRQQDLASANQTQRALVKELEAECNGLAQLSLDEMLSRKPAPDELLGRVAAKWAEASELGFPDAMLIRQCVCAQDALECVLTLCESLNINRKAAEKVVDTDAAELIQGLEISIGVVNKWPRHYPPLTVKKEFENELTELKLQLEESVSKSRDKLDKLHKRINRLLGSTNRGDLNKAKRELVAITKAISKYTGKEKAALEERVKKASDAVSKMRDWKDFATEPKYIEFCELMEALTESKAHADKLSVEINTLQKRWKALGHSDSADKHWERFKLAADKAYEPCAVFFAKRHETRQQNLEKREPYLQQMRDLLENTLWDEQPDYRAVESTLRKIISDWQKVKDVEQRAGQKQWKKLTKFRTAIHEKLDVVYDGNIEEKNQLIEQSQKLLDMDVTEDSLNKLKQLQTRWKQVGVTRRKEDQAAWKSFKTATDEVYEKIQGVRKAKRADEDAKLHVYRQVTRQIHDLAKTATVLADADSTFDRLQAEYKELTPLPRGLPEKLVDGLESDFRRASTAYSNARDRVKAAGKTAAFEALVKKTSLCSELEGLGENASTEDIQKIQTALDLIEISDNGLRKRFEKRLSAALNNKSDVDRSKAEEVRRIMCIDLEILLDADTPNEDSELRMITQLERMKKGGLGQAMPKKEDALSKMKLDWLCLPGAKPEVQEKLNKRFFNLIK